MPRTTHLSVAFGRSDRVHAEAWARGAITTIERRRLSSLF